MVLIWYEYVLITAIFAGILSLGGYLAFKWSRVRVQKWIGGAIGNFMTNLANQAAAEEGGEAAPGGGSTLNLGGFKIDPATIRSIAEILKVVQSLGFFKGTGEGGVNPFLKP